MILYWHTQNINIPQDPFSIQVRYQQQQKNIIPTCLNTFKYIYCLSSSNVSKKISGHLKLLEILLRTSLRSSI